MTQHTKRPDAPSAGEAAPEKKTGRRGVVILIVVACILALCVAGMILGAVKRHRNETAMQTVVVRGDGDIAITNRDLNYYYWSEYMFFAEAVTDELPGFDAGVSPAKQRYDETRTWQDYFLERTLLTIRDTQAMALEARQAGFAMPEDYEASYERALSQFREAAQEQGYRDVDAYLRASFGADATERSFAAYLYDTHLSAAYADALYDAVTLTDEEAADYRVLHEADYAGYTESEALSQAAEDLRAERYRNEVLSRTDKYALEVNYDAITIFTPRGLFQK